MRIRSRLLALVSAVMIPALVGAAIGIAYLYEEEHEFVTQSMRETARAFALSLESDMARRESMLQTLAASPALARGDLATFYTYASAVAAATDTAIILSDTQGRQLLNTRLPLGASLPPMLRAERENRSRLGNEVTVISDLYLPPANLGPHSFAIQVPVRRGGKVEQFLTMASFARQLQKLLSAQKLPAGWHATIIDRRGVIAARSAEPERFVGQPVRSELAVRLAQTEDGAHEGVNLAGERSTAFFSRAPGSGWVFLLAVPHAALYGPAIRAAALTAAAILVLLGLGLAAAWLVARRISRPVESLRAAAERLGHNEPVPRQRTGTVELDAVAEAMADASARLRDAKAELERRVAEALASYEHSQRALVQAQKLEALGRLTGGIAHDFNNVLQTLTAGLQALKLGAAPPQVEFLERCQRAVQRGSELARQLMAFGRVQEVRAETLETPSRLVEATPLFSGALPENVRLDFDVPDDLWPVTVDPAQLELALLNLVINARDAMPAGGGRIVLSGANRAVRGDPGELDPGDYVVLAVADGGGGMSEEVLARALDPFYTTKGVGKGSGMGLPQAYGFARQNGGTLTLESAPGRGTTARMYLPRSKQPVTPAQAAAPRSIPARSRGKVLFVEDDAEVRETVSSALRAAGFEIDTAASGDEALRRIESGAQYDAVLTDVVMPGSLNGADLAAHIRRRHPQTGVVIATGYSDHAIRLAGVRSLAKPYDLSQAVDALNAAMAR